MTAMKRQSVSDGRVSWANPSDISNTFVAKVASAPKTILGGGSIPNVSGDFVTLKRAPIMRGEVPAGDEQLSLRVRLSGSAQNAAVLVSEWELMKQRVDACLVELAAQGFVPADAVIPSSAT